MCTLQLNLLARTIPHFYEKGAHFLTAESSDNWGPNGLGYYLASRLMWNTEDATNIDALEVDFYEKAFGDAKGEMAKFYDLIDGSDKPLFSEDLIGRMYRQLKAARQATQDPAIRARINDLVLYTRYAELFHRYAQASKNEERQSAFEDLMKFTWRIRKTQMVHTLALWRDLAGRDKSVKFPEGSGYGSKAEKDPWKSDEPFTEQHIQQFVEDGIVNNPLRDFEIKKFSDDLMDASALHLSVPIKQPARLKFGYLRGNNELIVRLAGPATFRVKAGIIYSDRGKAKLSLHEYGQMIADDEEDTDAPVAPEALQKFEAPPDKEWHEYTFNAPKAGLYILRISDSSMGTEVEWPDSIQVTFASTLEKMWTFRARSAGYFYVPKGTPSVGGFASGNYHLYGPDGKVLLSNQSGYFNIPVPPGQDGKLWEFGHASGSVALLTVPSYFARSPQELLLPKEVVEADSRK